MFKSKQLQQHIQRMKDYPVEDRKENDIMVSIIKKVLNENEQLIKKDYFNHLWKTAYEFNRDERKPEFEFYPENKKHNNRLVKRILKRLRAAMELLLADQENTDPDSLARRLFGLKYTILKKEFQELAQKDLTSFEYFFLLIVKSKRRIDLLEAIQVAKDFGIWERLNDREKSFKKYLSDLDSDRRVEE